MLGTRIDKENFNPDAYSVLAEWCNNNGAMIEEREDYYIAVVIPPLSEAQLFSQLRAKRDLRLQRTDYLVQPDYPIDSDLLEKVKAYRQYLRDLPSLEGAPWDGGGPETPWPVNPLTVE